MNGHHLKLLKELSGNNTQSQRELSKRLGLSLGSVNYVLSGLIDKGLIKAKRFKNSKNKRAYMYILTPAGIKKKMELSCTFLLFMRLHLNAGTKYGTMTLWHPA